jgi:micrococcal nuclease
MYEYRVKIVRIIDGDTVDVDIDLGFGIWIHKERVRIMGIDTPESRTRDLVEKLFGLAAKARLEELLGEHSILRTQIAKDGTDMKGKFGRILGDFVVEYNGVERLVTEVMMEEGHCVPYYGGAKEDTIAHHQTNRERLLEEGVVSREAYEEALKG